MGAAGAAGKRLAKLAKPKRKKQFGRQVQLAGSPTTEIPNNAWENSKKVSTPAGSGVGSPEETTTEDEQSEAPGTAPVLGVMPEERGSRGA